MRIIAKAEDNTAMLIGQRVYIKESRVFVVVMLICLPGFLDMSSYLVHVKHTVQKIYCTRIDVLTHRHTDTDAPSLKIRIW